VVPTLRTGVPKTYEELHGFEHVVLSFVLRDYTDDSPYSLSIRGMGEFV